MKCCEWGPWSSVVLKFRQWRHFFPRRTGRKCRNVFDRTVFEKFSFFFASFPRPCFSSVDSVVRSGDPSPSSGRRRFEAETAVALPELDLFRFFCFVFVTSLVEVELSTLPVFLEDPVFRLFGGGGFPTEEKRRFPFPASRCSRTSPSKGYW